MELALLWHVSWNSLGEPFYTRQYEHREECERAAWRLVGDRFFMLHFDKKTKTCSIQVGEKLPGR
jgi:hypothetical protein